MSNSPPQKRASKEFARHHALRANLVGSVIEEESGTRAQSRLFRVVEDDADGVTHSGTNKAHAVTKVDAIRAFRPFHWPIMHGERNCIALPQWHHLHAALHAWP